MSEKTKNEKKDEYAEEVMEEEMIDGTEEMISEEEEKEEIHNRKDAEKKLKDQELKDREDEKKRRRGEKTVEEVVASWAPKTKLGKDVKSGKIKDIDQILDNEMKILEPEIVDSLIRLNSDLISIGQSKGKFGGGKRRAWRQTQRKTKEGNVPTFSTMAVVGDGKGHVGIGTGKSMETLPARDKALRKAKLNLIKVAIGDGSFDSTGGNKTSIPFKVVGKASSVKVTLIPAAPGTGLVVAKELRKILILAGVKDVYGRTDGKNRTTFNSAKACIDALRKTTKLKVNKN
jgi:small subunit ribosomal protein S5